jgi:mannose-1-phosphate guanylyltransferase
MAKAPDNLYVVIIAGGVGSRLWPKSRKSLPKQFFHLNGAKSLAHMTYKRLSGFIPDNRIFIVAPDYYKKLIKQELPNLPAENYILEPSKQGTTAANALSAMIIHQRNPDAIVHFLVADDYIMDNQRFQKTSAFASHAAEDGSVVVFGVEPHYPSTGFGYIKVGKKLKANGKIKIFQVDKFIEKPNEVTARRYLRSSKYFWHGSGFATQTKTIIKTLLKDRLYGRTLKKIQKEISKGNSLKSDKISKLYKQLVDKPIEYTFLEKISSVKMVNLEKTWSDVGSWSQVYDILPKDRQQNAVIGNKKNIILRNSFQNLIFVSNRLIAVTDIKGMVVVDTDDAVLVCPMPNAQNVKKIVEILKEKKLTQYI